MGFAKDPDQANLQAQLPTVRRQAERIAQGKKAWGAHPRTDVQAHLVQFQLAQYTASGLRYLLNELRRLLEVVVLEEASQHGILDSQHRQSEVETVVQLLAQLEQEAPPALAHEIHTLHTHLRLALPSLLLFARELDHLQQQVSTALGTDALYLISWAWQRRQILGPNSDELVKGFPSSWHPLAKPLLQAWDRAVRASSAVENWHSILRPHLAVHRTLSAEMLALLAVWHNHRVAPRGLHEGQSPSQRSGLAKEATDWLVALGYSPTSRPSPIRCPVPVTLKEEGLAA